MIGKIRCKLHIHPRKSSFGSNQKHLDIELNNAIIFKPIKDLHKTLTEKAFYIDISSLNYWGNALNYSGKIFLSEPGVMEVIEKSAHKDLLLNYFNNSGMIDNIGFHYLGKQKSFYIGRKVYCKYCKKLLDNNIPSPAIPLETPVQVIEHIIELIEKSGE